MSAQSRPGFGMFIYFSIVLMLGLYFTFAAVQGEFGIFARAEVEADSQQLQTRLDGLNNQIAVMENRTRRLSDEFLDIDLLDQQSRDMLGQIRGDEFVLQ
ncbi:septum formation initiator family protein [Pseudooceanicola sp. CBS1P-1]|uniref:Septum formation initiator family protein n=1 Tax=Pseudooceanicola albus TaxID=2692189 RepID=A0A6L7GA79_9RHOB|nr:MULTISPECIES: septum formation initiator family protein [Pseudooceanicola]MBT9384267.1 septum formation initiator family protein [Pseudooceanicola endophyticus]MXN20859.1 septum formation initiator family protein [Pseudooceanicola albus]